MKIARIETFRIPPRWLLVRIETDDGASGWGEASLEGHAEAVEAEFAGIRERLIGHDATRIEDAWQQLYRGGFYRGGPVLMSALSGVDQALWDLNGKALGVPVWRLLGGKVRDRVEVYSWIGGDRPHDVGPQAADRKAQGFRAVKMNAVPELKWLDSPAELDSAVERAQAVKDAGMEVGLDFHGRVHKPMVRQLAKRLEEVRPLFIEEPLLSENHEGLEQLSRMISTPIALGERLYSRWDVKRFLERGTVDILQPDLAHAGGLSECKRISSMAEAYDVGIAPHCPLGPIAFASCLHLAASTPNFVIQEMSVGIHYNMRGDLFTYLADQDQFHVSDGHVAIPDGPGLGVRLNEELIRETAKTPIPWRNPIWRNLDGGLTEW